MDPTTISSKINKTMKSNCEHLKIYLTKASNNTFTDKFDRWVKHMEQYLVEKAPQKREI